jgi:hypothetical protein
LVKFDKELMPIPPAGQFPQKDVISSFKYPWPFPQQPSLLYRIQANAITFGVFCMAKLILRLFLLCNTCIFNFSK